MQHTFAAELDWRLLQDSRCPKLNRPVPSDPSSDTCMNMASAWLEACARHTSCSPAADAPLPHRLIEIPEDTEQSPRLRISQVSDQGQYVTLSHCWGGGVTFVLKHVNYEGLLRAIDIADLPRNFQDAILITRRLGFKYLWIDALCIIQDSPADWARESAKMAQIYRNGSLMLSAVAGPDGQYGMLRPRVTVKSHHFGANKALLFQNTPEWTAAGMPYGRPLDTRAWCFQERVMAPRILHFEKHKLGWECASAKHTEETALAPKSFGSREWFEKAELEPFMRPGAAVMTMPYTRTRVVRDARDLQQRLNAYYECVEQYTSRNLTKNTDKLPAFSGLTSALRVPELGAYLAGLWEADLVHGLDWRLNSFVPMEKRPEFMQVGPPHGEYIGPSWSWASVTGRVHLNSLQSLYLAPGIQPPAGTEGWAAEFAPWSAVWRPRLVSHGVEPSTEDPHGMVRPGGHVVVEAYSRPLLLHTAGKQPSEYADFAAWAHLDRGTLDGYPWKFGPPCEYEHYWVDWPGEEAEGVVLKYKAVQVGRRPLRDTVAETLGFSMLILEAVEGVDGVYRRVGHLLALLPDEEMVKSRWMLQKHHII